MTRTLKPSDWAGIRWAQAGLPFDPRRSFQPEPMLDAPGWRLQFLQSIRRHVPGVLDELRDKVWPVWERACVANPEDPRLKEWAHLRYDPTPEAIELKRALLDWATRWHLAPGGYTETPATALRLSADEALARWRTEHAEMERIAKTRFPDGSASSAADVERKRTEFINSYAPKPPTGPVATTIPGRFTVAEQGSAGEWFLSAALETMNCWQRTARWALCQVPQIRESVANRTESREELARQLAELERVVGSRDWHADVVGGQAYYLPELEEEIALRSSKGEEEPETLPAIAPLRWRFDSESPDQFMRRAVQYLADAIAKLGKLGVAQPRDAAPPGWRDHLDRFAMFQVGGMSYSQIIAATGLDKGTVGPSIKKAAQLLGMQPRETRHAPRPRRRVQNDEKSDAEKSVVGRLDSKD